MSCENRFSLPFRPQDRPPHEQEKLTDSSPRLTLDVILYGKPVPVNRSYRIAIRSPFLPVHFAGMKTESCDARRTLYGQR